MYKKQTDPKKITQTLYKTVSNKQTISTNNLEYTFMNRHRVEIK